MRTVHVLLAICLLAVIGFTLSSGEDDVERQEHIADAENVVQYMDDGFEPSTIRIERGETVTWVSDGPAMWVASASHPTHADYGLDDHADPLFDQGDSGAVYTFQFNRTGDWQYHNHENGYHYGTVVVTD